MGMEFILNKWIEGMSYRYERIDDCYIGIPKWVDGLEGMKVHENDMVLKRKINIVIYEEACLRGDAEI